MPQQPQGLIFCVKDWSDTFCITKTIQFLVSLIMLLFMLHNFIVRFCKERELNFFCIVYTEMILALLSNCVFTLDHRIRPMMYIESYAYDLYYATIVYQVSRRVAQMKKGSQYFKFIWFGVHGLLIFFVCFLTVTFVVRNVVTYIDCEQTWFLVVNLVGIAMSVLIVIAGRFYSKFQAEKIEGMIEKNTKNPLPGVWKWIWINIACQFFRFMRSFIYIVSPYNCQFSGNYMQNEILGLLFDVFSFHVGMVATIIFFRRRNVQDEISSKEFESTIRQRMGTGHSKEIEMQSTVNRNIAKGKQDQLQDHRLTAKAFLDVQNSKRITIGQSNKMPIFSI